MGNNKPYDYVRFAAEERPQLRTDEAEAGMMVGESPLGVWVAVQPNTSTQTICCSIEFTECEAGRYLSGSLAPEIEAEFYAYTGMYDVLAEFVEHNKSAREHILVAGERYNVTVPHRARDICLAIEAKLAAEAALKEINLG